MDINLFKPVSDVVNKLIDKIGDACGFFANPRGLKQIQLDVYKTHAENVVNDISLSQLEKEEFIRSIPYLNKHNRNRQEIIEMACDNINEEASPENISDDWLMDYMDKIKNISSNDAQLLWGKLLSIEANSPGSISKRLVQNLYLMDTGDAWNFQKFTAFCFYDSFKDIAHPLIYLRNRPRLYTYTLITTQYLHNLQTWGLIECDYDQGYVFLNEKKLTYMGIEYTLSAKNLGGTFDAGNVRFTADGQALFRIVTKENDTGILEKTLETIQELGIKCTYNGKEGIFAIKN